MLAEAKAAGRGGDEFDSLLELWYEQLALSPSHTFAHLLTPTHTLSRLLTPPRRYEELADDPDELVARLDPITAVDGAQGGWTEHDPSVRELHSLVDQCGHVEI